MAGAVGVARPRQQMQRGRLRQRHLQVWRRLGLQRRQLVQCCTHAPAAIANPCGTHKRCGQRAQASSCVPVSAPAEMAWVSGGSRTRLDWRGAGHYTAAMDEHRHPTEDENASIATRRLPGARPQPAVSSGLAQGTAVGRFIVLEQIGKGGMGVVYAAWDPRLGRRVALKVLHRHADSSERARILREARALAQLTHPNVVRIYELGEIEQAPFIAMELVDGPPLNELLKGSVKQEGIFDLFAQAGRGLGAVHSIGIVHRDFKPGNVFVGRDGRACIGDFGLAIASEADTSQDSQPSERLPAASLLQGDITVAGAVPGTPAYMPPEQILGEALDARCDQYAFAIALWLAVYGERPFAKDDLHLTLKPPPPRPQKPTLAGRAVEPVLRRALSHRREDRYPDMAAFLGALERRRRLPNRLLGAAGLVLVLATLAAALAPRLLVRDPCGVERRAVAAVPDDLRTRLRRASTNPLADVPAHLDAYVAQWRSAAESVCQERETPERKAVQACLDQRLGDLTALASVLAAHPEAVSNALPAVLALPTPISCVRREQSGPTRLPVEQRQALESQLAQARAAWLAGRQKDAVGAATAVVYEATRLGDERTAAEAWFLVGMGQIDQGNLAAAEHAMRQALAGAMAQQADHLQAQAWVELINVIGDRSRRYEEALAWLPLERAAVSRAGGSLDLRARARFVEATLLNDHGDLEEAIPLAAEAVALAEQRMPRDAKMVSQAHSTYGNILAAHGQVQDGIVHLKQALQALEGALPPRHVAFAPVLNNLGVLYVMKGDRVRAREAFERTVSLLEGTGHAMLGVPYENLAELARIDQRIPQSRDLYERARSIALAHFGPQHMRTLTVEMGLALLLQDERRFVEAVEPLERVAHVLRAQNPHTRTTLAALLARAELALEAPVSAGERTAALEEVRASINDSDDLRGVRAQFALDEGIARLQSGDRAAAKAHFERGRVDSTRVEWPEFASVLAAWQAVASGQLVDCVGLPRHLAVVRLLGPHCRPAPAGEVPAVRSNDVQPLTLPAAPSRS